MSDSVMSNSEWEVPAAFLRLPRGEVHVWRVSLAPSLDGVRGAEWLSTDEHERAAHFRFPHLRERFIAGRAALRAVLARYTGTAPGELRFRYGARGKPALVNDGSRAAPRFNLSHSGDLALLAVARDRDLGVDLEQMRPLGDRAGVIRLFFSETEQAAHRLLAADLHERSFFVGWTRKEAYIKARGDGMALALDRFAVSLDPTGPAALLHVADATGEPSRWALRDLQPGPGYAAALAVEGRDWCLRCWQWAG
jgi:4'-phosphopantetheinyl transferase